MITGTEIKELITTIGLLNSMVECGESHSDISKKKVKKCLGFLRETDDLIPKLELDNADNLRKASYVIEYIVNNGIEYAKFNDRWVSFGDVLENEEGQEFVIVAPLIINSGLSTIATIRPKPKIGEFLYRKYSVL